MTDVAPGIITFGLGGKHDAMIIGFPFNLGFFEVIIPGSPQVGSPIIPPPPPPVGRGGTQAVFPDRTEDWDKDRFRSIIVRVRYKDKTTEKIYTVTEERAKFIIKVMNIINKTHSRIKIAVSGLKRGALNVFAKIKNVGSEDKDK